MDSGHLYSLVFVLFVVGGFNMFIDVIDCSLDHRMLHAIATSEVIIAYNRVTMT